MASNSGNIIKCVYCSNPVSPDLRGDHIIPAALGEFRGNHRFKNICSYHNGYVASELEDELLRCGPERFLRSIVAPITKRSRGKRTKWIGSKYSDPPIVYVNQGGMNLFAEPQENPIDLIAPEQLVISYENGESKVIFLFPHKSAVQIQSDVKKFGQGKIKEALLHSDEQNESHYREKLREVWPQSKYKSISKIEKGNHLVESVIKFTLTGRYFRAIAKIAFHYYLAFSQRAKGCESGFDQIKNYILKGGANYFVRPIITDGLYCITQWQHQISALEKDNEVFGYVCLFNGPHFHGNRFEIKIGRLPYRLKLPTYEYYHIYKYDNIKKSKSSNGEAIQVKNGILSLYSAIPDGIWSKIHP